MSGYGLHIQPKTEWHGDDLVTVKNRYIVRSTMPNLGFWSEKEVNEETKNLLEIAIEEGKDRARKEIRESLGL